MAKVIKKFSKTPNTLYDWDSWMDGQIRRVTRGVDFQCKAVSFRCYLLHKAQKLGFKARTTLSGDSVEFQLYKPKTNAKVKAKVTRDSQEDYRYGIN